MLLINCKDVSSNRFPWPPWYFVWHNFVFGSYDLKSRHTGQLLIASFLSAFMFIQYTSTLVFYMPICFICSCFTALFCSIVGMIILLPLMANPTYDCNLIPEWPIQLKFLFNSAFVDCQPWSMSSVNAWKCSFFRVVSIISSVVLQSGMSMHDSIALMVMHMSGICLSHFHACVWKVYLQWTVVALVYIVFWCWVGVSAVVFFEVCVIGLQHLP